MADATGARAPTEEEVFALERVELSDDGMSSSDDDALLPPHSHGDQLCGGGVWRSPSRPLTHALAMLPLKVRRRLSLATTRLRSPVPKRYRPYVTPQRSRRAAMVRRQLSTTGSARSFGGRTATSSMFKRL